jgi:hypothetical protein
MQYLYAHLQTPWLSVRRPNIPTERPPLQAKLVSTFAVRSCCMASAAIPHFRYSRFSRPETLPFFSQVAPHLSPRGWVGPVPDPLLLRKSGSVWTRTRDLWICRQELRPLDHRGGRNEYQRQKKIYIYGEQSVAGAWGWQTHRNLWADYLDNVISSTSHSLMDLHGLLRG